MVEAETSGMMAELGPMSSRFRDHNCRLICVGIIHYNQTLCRKLCGNGAPFRTVVKVAQ